MLLPFLLLFGLFFIYPIISGLNISFFKWNAVHDAEFVGLGNYVEIFNSRDFSTSFFNLFKYVSITVPLGISVAFGLALLVNHFKGFWSGLFRSAYFVPVMMPLFLAATIWRWIYAPEFGLMNIIIAWFGMDSVNFLNDPDVMLFSLIFVDVWISAGFNMVIILAGLKNIPQPFYEAAKIDGANKFQEIINITIPQLRPVLFFVVIYGFISALQVFDAPWLLTSSSYSSFGGREKALLFPVMDMMGRGFGELKFGQASAYGFILTLAIVAVTLIQLGIRKRYKWS